MPTNLGIREEGRENPEVFEILVSVPEGREVDVRTTTKGRQKIPPAGYRVTLARVLYIVQRILFSMPNSSYLGVASSELSATRLAFLRATRFVLSTCRRSR